MLKINESAQHITGNGSRYAAILSDANGPAYVVSRDHRACNKYCHCFANTVIYEVIPAMDAATGRGSVILDMAENGRFAARVAGSASGWEEAIELAQQMGEGRSTEGTEELLALPAPAPLALPAPEQRVELVEAEYVGRAAIH